MLCWDLGCYLLGCWGLLRCNIDRDGTIFSNFNDHLIWIILNFSSLQKMLTCSTNLQRKLYRIKLVDFIGRVDSQLSLGNLSKEGLLHLHRCSSLWIIFSLRKWSCWEYWLLLIFLSRLYFFVIWWNFWIRCCCISKEVAWIWISIQKLWLPIFIPLINLYLVQNVQIFLKI